MKRPEIQPKALWIKDLGDLQDEDLEDEDSEDEDLQDERGLEDRGLEVEWAYIDKLKLSERIKNELRRVYQGGKSSLS